MTATAIWQNFYPSYDGEIGDFPQLLDGWADPQQGHGTPQFP